MNNSIICIVYLTSIYSFVTVVMPRLNQNKGLP